MINMDNVPNNSRIPFTYVDFDNSNAIRADVDQAYRVLLIGVPNKSRTDMIVQDPKKPPTLNSPKRVYTEEDAIKTFGKGSMLHLMTKSFLNANTSTEVFATECPVTKDATTKIYAYDLTRTDPSKDTTLNISICGYDLPAIPIKKESTWQTITSDITARIFPYPELPFSISLTPSTGSNTPPSGGSAGGAAAPIVTTDPKTATLAIESTFASYTADNLIVTVKAGDSTILSISTNKISSVAGTGESNLAYLLQSASISDEQYHFIANPFSKPSDIQLIQDDMKRRWLPKNAIEGASITCVKSDPDNPDTLMATYAPINLQYNVLMPIQDSAAPEFVWAASLAGVLAYYGNQDPARPFGTLPIPGVPAPSRQYSMAQRDTLLHNGFSTFKVSHSGTVTIERIITTYRNDNSPSDTSYLSLNTMLVLSYLRFSFRAYFASKYPRCKLASDELAAQMSQGSAVMTPSLAKAEVISLFKNWEARGYVDNLEDFKTGLIVERNASDPSRLDFYMTPRLVSQLSIIGAKVSFII